MSSFECMIIISYSGEKKHVFLLIVVQCVNLYCSPDIVRWLSLEDWDGQECLKILTAKPARKRPLLKT